MALAFKIDPLVLVKPVMRRHSFIDFPALMPPDPVLGIGTDVCFDEIQALLG
jgi:hypothetical protein